MLDKIKSFLSGSSEDEEDTSTLTPEKAATVLLVEVALADGEYVHDEEEKIRQCLRDTFDLDEDESSSLLEEAEELAKHAVDHHRFTSTVKDGMEYETRVKLMENLWRVVMADGKNDASEDSLLRRLAPLLALSDRDRAHARQAAEARQD